ncbi:CD209 antigen-like protein B isoform X1 [Macrobrachium nipponense]|uniref:CD209 antigen-like protein B isoform X1 n=1 Tax=Macrobrachium nipponense TaxID=159736 RepID=UPI0030C83899
MECSSMAVASCFRLIATILLLAIAGRCSSQQMDHIQLGRIADSMDNLTQVLQGKAKSEGKSSGSSVSCFFLMCESVTCYIYSYYAKLQKKIFSIGLRVPWLNSVFFSAQAVASEKIASGIMKMFTLMATDHLVCEGGWLKLRSSCYFISKDTSTWEGSRQKCIALNSDLVKITHDEEYNFLRELAKGHNYYIGLSDLQEEGSYRWVADGTIHQIVESWWGEGEPSTAAEHCIHYFPAKDDRLNDINCAKEFRYICEKPAQLPWNFASVLDEEMPADK